MGVVDAVAETQSAMSAEDIIAKSRLAMMSEVRYEFLEDSTGNKKNPFSCLKFLFFRIK
jgi:hypothetical protein